MSNDNQNVFDIINLNSLFWKDKSASEDDLDKSKRHYTCIESPEHAVCTRIYKKSSANGKHLSISENSPEIFDNIRLACSLGKKVIR
jgi:hypothetical protein